MSNLNKIKGKVIKVYLDKERTIKFDLNAFAELEEMYGSVDKALEVLESGSIKAVRAILWAGLIHEEMNEDETYRLSKKQVGALVDISTLGYIMDAINNAMEDSLPAGNEQVNSGTEGNQ